MTSDSVPSHVPEESRKETSKYLRRVMAEWVKSDNPTTHSDDKIFSAMTQTKRRYPAIWVGLNDGKVILSCRGKMNELWDLSPKKSIYEDDERVLIGIDGENGDYEGDLIFQVSPGDVAVESALRVVNAQQAVSEKSENVERSIERLPKGKGEGLFKRFLNKHPQLRHDLKKGEI